MTIIPQQFLSIGTILAFGRCTSTIYILEGSKNTRMHGSTLGIRRSQIVRLSDQSTLLISISRAQRIPLEPLSTSADHVNQDTRAFQICPSETFLMVLCYCQPYHLTNYYCFSVRGDIWTGITGGTHQPIHPRPTFSGIYKKLSAMLRGIKLSRPGNGFKKKPACCVIAPTTSRNRLSKNMELNIDPAFMKSSSRMRQKFD